tara:strand:+ start:507 stop:1223 length:717 start_codon:yes stop_codon:yes gene_type:complete
VTISLPDTADKEVKKAVMVQHWSDLVFIHWRYPAEIVQSLLPQGVKVEQFDGSAWVGLIPFHMNDLGFPLLHPLPYVGSFPEVNVRTYVRYGEYSGVWFFSLDINKILPTVTARTIYEIPYCYGNVSHRKTGNFVTTNVIRKWPKTSASSTIVIETDEPTDGDLERFLTARWGLITKSKRNKFLWAQVHHPPWQLHSARLLHLDDTLVTAAGLPEPEGRPHVMYSEGVPVRIGWPKKI